MWLKHNRTPHFRGFLLVGAFGILMLLSSGHANALISDAPNKLPYEQLPSGAPANPDYADSVYMNLSQSENNSDTGSGITAPDGFIKIYSKTQSDKNIYIDAAQRRADTPTTSISHDFNITYRGLNIDSAENVTGGIAFTSTFRIDKVAGNQGYGGYNITIPTGAFVRSTRGDHMDAGQGLYVAIVFFHIDTPVGSPKSATLRLQTPAPLTKTKLGYLGNNGDAQNRVIVKYPSLNNPEYKIRMEFRSQCNSTGSLVLHWKDDDFGTSRQSNDSGFRPKLYSVDSSGSQTFVGSSPGLTTSGPGDGGVGTYTFNPIPNTKYVLEFQNVNGGNGIGLYYPYDSADYYMDCYRSEPDPVLGNREVRGICQANGHLQLRVNDTGIITGGSPGTAPAGSPPSPNPGTARPIGNWRTQTQLPGIITGSWDTANNGNVIGYNGYGVTYKEYDITPDSAGNVAVKIVRMGSKEGSTAGTYGGYVEFYNGNPADPGNPGVHYGTFSMNCPQPHSPVVAVDQVSCMGSLSGWAYDPDYPAEVVSVHVYRDNPADNGGTFIGGYDADIYRADVAYGGGSHGYDVSMDRLISDSGIDFRDGSDTHKFYVYAIDSDGRSINTGPGGSYGTDVRGTDPITMAGCRPYSYSGSSVATGDTENPGTITFTGATGLVFAPATGAPSCVKSTSVTYRLFKYAAGAPTVEVAITGNNPTNPYATNCPPNETKAYDTYTVPIGSFGAGDRYCMRVNISPGSGYVDNNGNRVGTAGADDTTDASRENCLKVHNEPYVHTLGADVSSGGGFDGGTCVTNGGIKTYTKTTGQQPVGSGTQLAAMSRGQISGFSSVNLRGSNPIGSLGLTFSNTNGAVGSGSGAPALGGNLGGGNNCITNYFSKMPGGLVASGANAMSANFNPATGGAQYREPNSGTLKINGGSIADATPVAIYVKGNVYITNDIKYSGSSNWGSPDDIPSFVVVAIGGNIYIGPGVKQLDGVYVSQPDTASVGGTIHTCHDGTAAFNGYNSSLTNCKTQLIVNGAFVANKIILGRSYSSLRYSSPGERLNYANKDCGSDFDASVLGDCAAEIFNFSPEMYLGRQATVPKNGPTTGTYEYITSLSPVL